MRSFRSYLQKLKRLDYSTALLLPQEHFTQRQLSSLQYLSTVSKNGRWWNNRCHIKAKISIYMTFSISLWTYYRYWADSGGSSGQYRSVSKQQKSFRKRLIPQQYMQSIYVRASKNWIKEKNKLRPEICKRYCHHKDNDILSKKLLSFHYPLPFEFKFLFPINFTNVLLED